uniref:Gypsy retrotransposon integrase-like protein 1 n=1 Tax=Pelodiscus sinensis TaxID=13735 RepID=K7EZ52_PELSI
MVENVGMPPLNLGEERWGECPNRAASETEAVRLIEKAAERQRGQLLQLSQALQQWVAQQLEQQGQLLQELKEGLLASQARRLQAETTEDSGYAQVPTVGHRARENGPAKAVVEVRVEGTLVRALIDSGCSQTMVQESLVKSPEPAGGPVLLQCVHGDIKAYPTAWVRVADACEERICRVGLAPQLAYPVILGRDWPGLRRLVQEWAQQDPPETGRRPRTGTVVAQGENPEPEDEPGVRAGTSGSAETPTPPIEEGETEWLDARGDFMRDQREDLTLSRAWEQIQEAEDKEFGGERGQQGPRFEVRNDRLYRVALDPQTGEESVQLLVPARYRKGVLRLGHASPWAGHLGREKTLQRVAQRFFWPGIHREVREFCESCPECQRTNPKGVPKAPLVALPVVGVPFERIGLDLVGPLEKASSGCQYILVIVDYATRYPEAVPLQNTTATTIAAELMGVFSRVGIPKEILTDQGTNVPSKLMAELCRLLNIRALRTTVYHPQTDGLVERFN